MQPKGMVFLVGAGRGDAGLLTLRGAELLAGADVVVYDALVNSDLLELAPAGAEIIFGGKRSGILTMPQDELNRLLISKARAGKRVIRLKGGDPYVFGRGGEEAEQLADAGVEFEVVPGVAFFVAVPKDLRIPLFPPEVFSKITPIKGQEEPASEDFHTELATEDETPRTATCYNGAR